MKDIKHTSKFVPLIDRIIERGGEIDFENHFEDLVKSLPELHNSREKGEELAQKVENALTNKDEFYGLFIRLMTCNKYTQAAEHFIEFPHLVNKVSFQEVEKMYGGTPDDRGIKVLEHIACYAREDKRSILHNYLHRMNNNWAEAHKKYNI